jgi:Outer membrane cobalamin receptor protein
MKLNCRVSNIGKIITTYLFLTVFLFNTTLSAQQTSSAVISGTIVNEKKEPVEYATVFLKNTNIGTTSNEKGNFTLQVPTGSHIFCVSFLGYATFEEMVNVRAGERKSISVLLKEDGHNLDEVVITASGVNRVNQSAYNAIAIDTRSLQNSTRNLGDAITRAPGVKLRESGGVGSDIQLMLDGFSGRHVKIFIDGIPQEGVGGSFGLNNIPVNFAERIEVYKGVVPVGFGTDAIGGIVNIVTKRDQSTRDQWFVDASYSYGSFNTHKSYVNFGRTHKNGLTYEINAFQNYSDNSYYVDTRVKHFLDDGLSRTPNELFRVKRFHDTYHNEAIVGSIGVNGKSWADRLRFGFTYSQMHGDVQNGVRQEVVFGGRYREGYSLMPSLEYSKRNILISGLDVRFTAGYNRNITNNVDTSRYEFNWFGEKRALTNPGEQSYQHNRQYNDNWNGTLNLNYRIGEAHLFTFNHTLSTFSRNSRDMLIAAATLNPIPNENRKGVSGLSYRLAPSERWNMSVFGKYYTQYASGITQVTGSRDFEQISRSVNFAGYGATGTYFITNAFQAKLSYEKAARTPTNNEMFGDGDLESGSSTLRPESSHNLNLSLGYDKNFGKHSVYAEGTLIYRDTRDYIMRTINSSGMGGISQGQYINHGKVLTNGFNAAARYGFSNVLSVGGSVTQTNARNNVRTTTNANEDVTYEARMPNLPHLFSNMDLTVYWHNLGKRGNILTLTYDNHYQDSFPLNFENVGSRDEKRFVPKQFSHSVTASYSLNNGRYNISFECQNLTDANLYDSFSLQKAGRAFYGKFRVYLNNQ